MKALLKKIFGRAEASKAGFSSFFRNASEQEKKKLIKEVVREANADQRKILEKYDRQFSKAS